MASVMARHHDQLAFTLAAAADRRAAQHAGVQRLAILAHQPELASLRQQIQATGGGAAGYFGAGPWAGLDQGPAANQPPSRLGARLGGQQGGLSGSGGGAKTAPPARKLSRSDRQALGEFGRWTSAEALDALQGAPAAKAHAEATREAERQRRHAAAQGDVAGGLLSALFGASATAQPANPFAAERPPGVRPPSLAPSRRHERGAARSGSRGRSPGGARGEGAAAPGLGEAAAGELGDFFSSGASAVSQMSKQMSAGLQDTFKVPDSAHGLDSTL